MLCIIIIVLSAANRHSESPFYFGRFDQNPLPRPQKPFRQHMHAQHRLFTYDKGCTAQRECHENHDAHRNHLAVRVTDGS